MQSAGGSGTNSVGIKWVMLIYFFSGVCSLIDEVVWVRLLKLTLGNTIYASSIVVSVFMAGLALGALLMGRHADRIRKRLRLYALLEIVVTISALSIPWALQIMDGAYRWFFVKYQPSPTVLLVAQVIVSAVILLIPSMVMGSTLPLLGRYVTAMQDRVGRLVGKLYALNMLGAAVGCFLAGFVLIRIFGVMGTLYIAASINLLVAFGGWMLSRFHDVTIELPAKSTAAQQPLVAQPEKKVSSGYRVLMQAVFLSGLISIGYELIWMRSIVFLLGGFTYVFSAVLTVYLLGNVMGAWIGTRLSKRLKHPIQGFGFSLFSLGIMGIFYINWLSLWYLNLKPNIDPLLTPLTDNSTFLKMVWLLGQCIFLFFLPAVAMGIGFPLALQAWAKCRHKVGQTTAVVYGVNTIGAVLGGVVTGFLLIPILGTQSSIMVLGLMAIWLGVIMVLIFVPKGVIIKRMVYLAIAAGLTITTVIIPSDLFVQNVIRANGEIVAVKEGITTTVSVHRESNGGLLLATSGIRVAGDSHLLRGVQKVLGHLSME